MIVVLKQNAPEEKQEQLIKWIEDTGLTVDVSKGKFQTVLGLVGDTSKIDAELIESLEIVDSVRIISRKEESKRLTVGVVGLGLIGGSFARAYSKAGHTVYAFDVDRSVLAFAGVDGDVDAELTEETACKCDLILICTYPEAAKDYLRKMGPHFGKKPIVMDCCGTKRNVVDEAFEIAHKYNFTFVGAHPMAGTQFSGFKYSRADLYRGAPMVIVPEDFNDIALLSRVKELLSPCGFGKFSVTTAEKHDKMIAFTSQLAHVVSNAYIKSPTALDHKGFSAGSYKDMTRVAWLNPKMWTELFMDNGDFLLEELDIIINSLKKYRTALEKGDEETLMKLLQEGRDRKKEVDG